MGRGAESVDECRAGKMQRTRPQASSAVTVQSLIFAMEYESKCIGECEKLLEARKHVSFGDRLPSAPTTPKLRAMNIDKYTRVCM